jgi:hypothetical protein
MKDRWPETLTREQFINALEQFLDWLDDPSIEEWASLSDAALARAWVDHMDAIAEER